MNTLIKITAYLFLVGIIILLTNPLSAQTLSLDSILIKIEKNNPELKIYDDRVKAFDIAAEGARSQMAPQIGGGFFMTSYNVNMWTGDEMGNQGMGSFMVSAQQMITNRKKLDANEDFMKSHSSVDSSMKNIMRNELMAMAKTNYYEWMIFKKKLLILDNSEELLNYLIKSTELKYTYEMSGLTAYYKAKAMLGDLQIMKVMLKEMIAKNMNMLNTLMNRDKSIVFDIDTTFTVQQYENAKPDSSQILGSRSEFSLISSNINVLKAKQNLENAKKYPDYGIQYSHMFPFGRSVQQFSLMFMVSVPIVPWSSKMYDSKVKSINYEILSMQDKQSSLLNQIDGNIHNLQIQIRSKKQQLELTEKTVISSMQKNYDAELLAYEQNTEMLFMVLDAWQNLNLSKLTYLDQLLDVLKLQVKYEKELEVRK